MKVSIHTKTNLDYETRKPEVFHHWTEQMKHWPKQMRVMMTLFVAVELSLLRHPMMILMTECALHLQQPTQLEQLAVDCEVEI